MVAIGGPGSKRYFFVTKTIFFFYLFSKRLKRNGHSQLNQIYIGNI